MGVKSSRREFICAAAASLAVDVRAASVYSERVLEKRPVAYWRLGERRGQTAIDASGNGHSGVYRGTPLLGEKGALKDDPDTAIRIAPPDSYVEIPSSSHFSQPSSGQGLTVEAWVRPDALVFSGETDDPYIYWLGKGDKGEFEWGFRFYSRESSRPNRISAYIWNLDGGLGSGAYFQDPLKPGQWMHVVACFDPGDERNPGAGVSIYRNGRLRGGPATQKGALYSSFKIKPQPGKAPVRLGTRDLASFLTGALDEVAIYGRTLTGAEILDHYRAGSGMNARER
jgi:hypothetical protein